VVRDAEKRLGCVVQRGYGSTEVPTLTATAVGDSEDARFETDGRPIGPAEVRVVGPSRRAVRPGEEGEIWARSPEVFLGYRDAALDDGAFDRAGWYRTGDLGTVDGNGLLRVTGRRRHTMSGEGNGLKEVEDLLSEHPAIDDVAIVEIPDAGLGDRACAFVVPRDNASPTLESVVEFLRAREIAPQRLPERLEVRRRLPKTPSGKIIRAVLRNELRSNSR
jgi:cyclohexanecarboxylate-CoA ligase